MAHELTIEARAPLFENAPVVEGDDGSEAIRTWLGTVDFKLGAPEGSAGCSVLALISEQPAALEVYAIPDSEIGERLRADLDATDRPNFSLFFDADLAEEQFAGTMWILAACDVEGNETVQDELEEDLEIDWDAIKAGRGSWKPYRLDSGGKLPGPVTHLYVANYAP